MKRIIKYITLILTIFLMTSCYPFSYLDLADYIKKQGNGYEATVKFANYSDQYGMIEEYYAFYDQTYDECGLYSFGAIDYLSYYIQIVFNDGTEAMSYIRFDLDRADTKEYEFLGTLDHKNMTPTKLDLETGWENVYGNGTTSLLNEYRTFLLNSIARLIRAFEKEICPKINKTLKDFGFSNL